MPMQSKPNPEALLDAIEKRPAWKGESNYVILVNAEGLTDLPNFGEIFHSLMTRLGQVMNARTAFMGEAEAPTGGTATIGQRSIELFLLSDRALGVFMSANEYRIIGAVNEIKLNTLRVLERQAPNRMPFIDQATLIQVFDIGRHKRAALQSVEALSGRQRSSAALKAPQPMAPTQVGSAEAAHSFADQMALIEDVVERIGPAAFFEIFVGRQQIVLVKDHGSAEPVYTEHFVKLAKVRDYLFRGRLDLDRTNFARLTQLLDRIVLRGFAERPGLIATNSAINLNVSTVFQPEFEVFETIPEAALSKLTVEFSCADILQTVDEFLVARDLILSRSGKITIDGVQPNLLGVIDFTRLGASLVKLIWSPAAEQVLAERRAEIAQMQAAGIIFVLSRVEDEHAVSFGKKLRIRLFQGFHLDNLVRTGGGQVKKALADTVDRLTAQLEDFAASMRIFGAYHDVSGEPVDGPSLLARAQSELSETELTAETVEELQLLIGVKRHLFALQKEFG